MIARLVGSMVAVTLAAATSAGDLASIDRQISKEPTYRGQPYYALLAFGPEAERTA